MQIATLTNEQMPASKLLDRATVEQWAAEAREDLPNQLGTDFDEMEVMLAVARRAAEQAAPAISEEDRRELVAGAGLLAGHGHQGSAQALLRVLGIPVQQSEPVAVVDGGTPGPWSVRKRLGNDGEVLDCFVTAPDCQGLAYAAEILGDDEYRDGIKRRLADCELIVAAVNAYRAANAAPQAVQAAVPEFWKLVPVNPTAEMCKAANLSSTNRQRWADMLAAAPAHPAEGVPAQAVAVADARSARQIADAIVENFKDAGWSTSSIDDARVLEAVSAAIGEHGATEPLTGVASDVDSMARVLMAAFAKAEPEHPITRYPTSFVATFADMARAAIAAAQLADGVPAQSYVADFFREKGFYPSLAQAFAAGVAHAAAMPAQTVDEIMELADEYAGAQACAVTATSTADADTTKERNALLSAIRAALAATQLAVQRGDAQAWNDFEALRHSANEWADMATSGLQWLRNIVDGISDPKQALANLESNLKHCRAVNDDPAAQRAIKAIAAAVAAKTVKQAEKP